MRLAADGRIAAATLTTDVVPICRAVVVCVTVKAPGTRICQLHIIQYLNYVYFIYECFCVYTRMCMCACAPNEVLIKKHAYKTVHKLKHMYGCLCEVLAKSLNSIIYNIFLNLLMIYLCRDSYILYYFII